MRSLFDRLGGTPTLQAVHNTFYEKIYDHPRMKKFFEAVPRQHIEDQQTAFMTGAMGGKKIFAGRKPRAAHMHMFITKELFDLRAQMLHESIAEHNIDPLLMDEWMQLDARFEAAVVKKNRGECEPRYATDTILDF